MKAVIRRRPGRPELAEVPPPTEDVVEVHATSLNRADWHAAMGKPWILRWFKVPIVGTDVAGVVMDGPEKGASVLGDAGTLRYGGHAEEATLPPNHRCLMPDGMSYEDAACIPTAGLTALQGLRDWGAMQPGDRVFINGASGGVGSFAVQVAKALGASSVTAMCSTKNAAFVRSLGADDVQDYTKQEPEGTYDVFLDIHACRPLRSMKKYLKPGGKWVLVGGEMRMYWRAMLFGKLLLGKHYASGTAKPNTDDLAQLVQWVQEGVIKVAKARTIKLAQVPDEIIALGAERTVGKIAVRVR